MSASASTGESKAADPSIIFVQPCCSKLKTAWRPEVDGWVVDYAHCRPPALVAVFGDTCVGRQHRLPPPPEFEQTASMISIKVSGEREAACEPYVNFS